MYKLYYFQEVSELNKIKSQFKIIFGSLDNGGVV